MEEKAYERERPAGRQKRGRCCSTRADGGGIALMRKVQVPLNVLFTNNLGTAMT